MHSAHCQNASAVDHCLNLFLLLGCANLDKMVSNLQEVIET